IEKFITALQKNGDLSLKYAHPGPNDTVDVSLSKTVSRPPFGKLLTHFEDDLELYPSADAVRSLVRDPIAFELPESVEISRSQTKQSQSNIEELQQKNYCNNWQFGNQKKNQDSHSQRVVRVETPSVLTSSTISSLFSATANTNSARKANKKKAKSCYNYECDFRVNLSPGPQRSCDYYFGPIKGLHPSAVPPRSETLTPSLRQLRGSSRCQKLQRCRPLSPPLLLELDGFSGRTEALGCVPSVPVARPRLVTHPVRGPGRIGLNLLSTLRRTETG
uniref:DBF4-type domain-containing protein n=1 Tax=Macrostomum lignano TaxID=282301 RepID=A0A1I8IZQ2_9PLAT